MASITDLQVECSEAQLEIITGNLQRKWNDTAKLLGLDKNVISKIEEGGKNPFAEIISNWKKKRNDSSFTYDTLITEFCKSSEFTGKKEYVEQTILSLIPSESSTSDDTAVEQLVDTTDNSLLQHPKNPFESSDQIGQQYALLVEAVTTCIINRDIAIEDFRAFITEIIGSKQDDILFADYIGEVFELPSIKNAFEFFNRFSSSIDVELLELILEKFPCDQCNDYFITYKEKLTKSKYSEHIVPKLSAGEKFVSCTFRGLNDPDPICGDIIKGKSFCLAFDIRPCALRLVECCKPKEVVTLKWQVFPKSVEIFQEELSDDSLQKLAPLKLKSLQVETTRLYFYCLPNVTQETSDTESDMLQAGDAVLINDDISEARQLQEGHGGWNEEMAPILGKQAFVLQIDSDKDALLYIPAIKRKFVLNPVLLKKITDDTVNSVELDVPQNRHKFKIGDIVVLCDLHKLIALQSKHNGITDDMCQNANDIAFVVHIHDHDHVRADMLPMRRTFHPQALIPIPRNMKVKDGIKYLQDKIVGESPFMERIKKAESSDSDLNNLLLAIVFRDENWLTDYLEGHQGQVNTPVYKNHTALHLATLTDSISIVRILLDKGAKVEIKNAQGFASLHFATMSKFLEITNVLLSSDGGNINMKTMGGFTPLMIAATNNEDDVVKFLCEYSGTPSLDLDVKNSEGGTALHHAIVHDGKESTRILIDYGADPTIPNHLGHNGFHVAAINGKTSVMEPLIEAYPQFVSCGDLKDITSLHWAAYHGNYEIALLILDKTNIDINIRDSSGGTALFTAAMQGHTNLIHLLIGYGADPNACRTDKDTPLHALLHFSGRMDPIKEVSTELLKIKDILPETVNLKMTVACFLVKEKADLYQKGDDDKTPISLITNQEVSEIVKSFCNESSDFKGSFKRSTIPNPSPKRSKPFWIDKHAATSLLKCGHILCEEHANTLKNCPRCTKPTKLVKPNEEAKPIEVSTNKVCHSCIKAEIEPMAMGPFGDMMNPFGDMMRPPEGLGEEFEDRNFQDKLREMAASAAAEAVENNCRQQ